MLQRYIHPSF